MIDYMKNQMGLLFDLSLVHPDRAGLQLPQVSPHRPVGKQGTDVFRPGPSCSLMDWSASSIFLIVFSRVVLSFLASSGL